MTVIADHIAAFVIEIARNREGGYSFFLSDLPDELFSVYGIVVPLSLAEAACNRLVRLGGATKLVSPLTGDLFQVDVEPALRYYEPSAEPNEHTSRYYDTRYEAAHSEFPIIRTYFHGGRPWIERAVEALKGRDLIQTEADFESTDATYAPASDRIVSIDHNSVEAKKLDSDLADLSEMVRKENSDKIANPSDKSRLIEQFKAARDLLRLDRISVRAISGLLLPALAYLAMKFADEAIGELAGQLLAALQNLLGIVF